MGNEHSGVGWLLAICWVLWTLIICDDMLFGATESAHSGGTNVNAESEWQAFMKAKCLVYV